MFLSLVGLAPEAILEIFIGPFIVLLSIFLKLVLLLSRALSLNLETILLLFCEMRLSWELLLGLCNCWVVPPMLLEDIKPCLTTYFCIE